MTANRLSSGRRTEYVPKFRKIYGSVQVSALGLSDCKSVGVCLRRFESCTCHSQQNNPLTSGNAGRGVCLAVRLTSARSGSWRLSAPTRRRGGMGGRAEYAVAVAETAAAAVERLLRERLHERAGAS
jgi:hypothetical protein